MKKTLPVAKPQAPYAEGNHQHAHADHDAERPEDDKRVWPILRRKIFQRRHLLVQAMGEDQAAKRRDFQPVFGAFFIHIGHAKQQQRGGFSGFVLPVAFYGSDFCRLMFKRVEPMHIANDSLDRRDQQGHPHRHGKHFTYGRRIIAPQKMPGGGGADEHRAAEKSGNRHMGQTIGERRVKDNRQPVLGNDMTVFNGKTLRRLHPAI